MITVKKTGKYSINIYLDKEGVSVIRNGIEKGELSFSLSDGSKGFKGKSLQTLTITTSKCESIRQKDQKLILEIHSDDLEYFKFKLDQYLVKFDFIPEELFTIDHEGNSIHFYLTKIDK